MDERQPGYQTVLSQLVAAVAGRGWFYYAAISTVFFVLVCSAQTSFADFPRVCRLLADDGFLPAFFANRGRRLVYSSGIIVLSLLAGVLMAVFNGVTDSLIPLFAIGAFSAFVFSQVGMVAHWKRHRGSGTGVKLALNALGAATTGAALVVIVIAKFAEGAWIILAIGPGLVWLFWKIKHHYERVERVTGKPVKLRADDVRQPAVVVPIYSWNCVAELALRFAMKLSDDVTALHVSIEGCKDEDLREVWAEKVEKPARAAGVKVPHLEIVQSPYRKLYGPVLDFVKKKEKETKDRLIAVVIPELVEPHWYEYLLHNLHAAGLRALLFMESDQRTVVITTPWYL